jgi:hypothetical protein
MTAKICVPSSFPAVPFPAQTDSGVWDELPDGGDERPPRPDEAVRRRPVDLRERGFRQHLPGSIAHFDKTK